MEHSKKLIVSGILVLANLIGLCQDSVSKKFISGQIVSNYPKRRLLLKAKDSNWIAIYNKQTKEIYQVDTFNHKDSTYTFLFAKGQLLRGILYVKPELEKKRHRKYSFDYYNGIFVGDTSIKRIYSKEIRDVLMTSNNFYLKGQAYLEQTK